MNSVLATSSQHFSPADTSGSNLEKMDRLMSKLSRHSSPETNPNATTVIPSPQRSSPETPKMSSLPATPGSHHGQEYNTVPESGRPRSLETGPNAEESYTITPNDSTQGKRAPSADGLNPPSLSPPSVNMDYQSPGNVPNWFEIIQQLNTICQGKLGAIETDPPGAEQTVSEKETDNSVRMARSILSNLNQLLFSSKPCAEPGKSRPDDLTLPNTHASSSFASSVARSTEDMENNTSRQDAAKLKTTNYRTPTNVCPSPFPLPNPVCNPDPLTSATASLLAMMMEQKQPNPSASAVTSNPFFMLPTLWPNSFVSQPSTAGSMQPPQSAATVSQASTCTAESGIPKPPFPTDFPDNRGFLYQLGQQLMAMATSPGTEPLLRSPWWNFSSNPESATLPISSSSSVPASTVPVFQPNTSTSLLTDPMLALMNAALFQTPTQPPMLPTTPLATAAKHPSVLSPTMLHSLKTDKTAQNFSHHSPAMTGISMRGNQKYSAYYQHQRKQGLQYGGVTNENFMNGTPSRRQTPSLSVPFPCSRLGNRRLKGAGPMNSAVSDFRGNANVLGARGVAGGGTAASHMFPATRGGVFKHSSAIPTGNRLKSQMSADMGHHGNATNDASPKLSSRLRDTAFLCSCGQDFESLYGFSVHMKDTGHKPKSDHSERDIPKLVRGQDMWINSETEQTREILRCMRCHQSFRNLPELTWHMMKTNHYSEIVYNDSGRLVFVNPDEQRRATQNGTAVPSAGSSPSKGAYQPNKRGTGVKHSSPIQGAEHRPQDSELAVNRHEKVTHHRDGVPLANSSADSTSSGRSEGFGHHSPECKIPSDSPVAVSSATPGPQEPNVNVTSLNERSVSASPDSRSSDKAISTVGCSVIRQIESFVESNLSQKSHLLSVRTEPTSSIASRVSSPASIADSRSGLQDNPADCRNASGDAGTRTISGASPSHAPSDASSSSPSTNCEKSRDSPYFFAAKRANLSPKSPVKVSCSSNNTNTTTTGGFNALNTENPLSSLQKLVDTTHKSPYGMMSGPVSNCPNPHGNQLTGQLTGNLQTKHSPQALSRAHTPKSKSSNFPSGSMSSSPNFTDLLSPTGTEDDHVPALSALYAYVEKSSNSHPDSRTTKEGHGNSAVATRTGLNGPGDGDKSNSDQDLIGGPSFQALYAAALSRLTTYYLQTATANTGEAKDSPLDPVQFFRNVASNFEQSLQSTTRPNESKLEDSSSTGWAKLMQTFASPNVNQATAPDPRELTNVSRTPPFEDDPEHRVDEPHQSMRSYSDEYDKQGGRDKRTHPATMQDDPRAHKMGRYAPVSQMTSRLPGFIGVTSPQSSPPLSNSESMHFNRVSTASTSCHNPLMTMRASGNTNTGNPLMSTIITKKAKCHFCGKPFANKGQVRLHISKNKCPCLLQRSCHVAALAAAFGSDAPQAGTGALPGSNKRNVPNAMSLPSAPGGMASNKNLAQLMLSDPCARAHEESVEQPSALSLLKERFQNFDQNLMGSRPVPEDMYRRERFAESLAYQNMANAHDQAGVDAMDQSNHDSATGMDGCPSQLPLQKNADVPTAIAATNAGHLAAMALLAQTLVQLGSAQVPRLPELPRSNPMATASDKGSLMPIVTTSTPQLSALPPLPTAAAPDLNGLSWDWLLSQLHLAKQMSSFTWPNQTTEQPMDQDSPSASTVPSSQGASTPTSSS